MGAKVMLANGRPPLNIGLFTCHPAIELTDSQATCGGWLPTLEPGKFRALGSALRLRARRRVRRAVRVGMGLPRHDEEVYGVVTKDDEVLEFRIRRRARHAQTHVPKRRRRHGVPRVPHLRLLRQVKLALASPFARA